MAPAMRPVGFFGTCLLIRYCSRAFCVCVLLLPMSDLESILSAPTPALKPPMGGSVPLPPSSPLSGAYKYGRLLDCEGAPPPPGPSLEAGACSWASDDEDVPCIILALPPSPGILPPSPPTPTAGRPLLSMLGSILLPAPPPMTLLPPPPPPSRPCARGADVVGACARSSEMPSSEPAAACACACFSLSSAARKSLKYGCLTAWRADMRSSGSYASSLTITSTHSAEQCGMSRASGVASLCGKLKSMCEFECFLSFASVSAGGVPKMAWIFCTWSSSLVPGKRG